MKTTIHLGKDHRMTVEPNSAGLAVTMETRGLFGDRWITYMVQTMTPDQAGALIFGMEQALESKAVQL